MSVVHFFTASAAEPETFSLSRYITIKTCYKGASCEGPVAKNIDRANVHLQLLPPVKSSDTVASDAWDRDQIRDGSVRIKSEIHVLKHKKPGRYKYTVVMRLSSGGRKTKTQKIKLRNLNELGPTVISDDPVTIDGGTVQAQLVIGPKLPLDQD